MDKIKMDKKGNPKYMRLPKILELMVEQIAIQEGRDLNSMIAHLIARGLHNSFYDPEKYLISPKSLETGQFKSEPKFRRAISLSLRFEVFKRDNFMCQYCGKRPPEVILELDHIVPISKGGQSNIENLKTACLECNLGKKDK